MESNVIPLACSPPPPLDDVSGDEVGLEEDEFGDFSTGGVSSSVDHADVRESPSFFRQTSPIDKPATNPPNPSFNLREQTHHALSEESGNCNPKSSLHYLNGHSEEDRHPGAFSGSIASCTVEETSFADFTLFTEQAGHPWCCGFMEQCDGKVEGWNHSIDEHARDSGREFIAESEPQSQHVCKASRSVCVGSDVALKQPPQDHHQFQEDEVNIHLGSPEGKLNTPVNTPTFPQTLTVEEPASDDWASCHDNWSLEGASSEVESNVLSLTSQDGQTDDEVEVMENFGLTDFVVSSSMANLVLSESEMDAPPSSATQETSATSCLPDPGTHFTDINIKNRRESVETADTGSQYMGTLPSSDSFADFCSAPTRDHEEGLMWADFTDQGTPAEGRMCTQHKKPGDGVEWEESQPDGVTGMNRCQAFVSCNVQQLLQSSFPEIRVPAVEGEEDLPNLGALLHTQHSPETKEEIPELSHALRIQQVMFSLHEDIYCSLGLQFKWGGSKSNTALLRCLGVDPKNIVFIGTKKQAVTVPAYASSLGMLDPTKEPLPAACSPGDLAVTAPSGPRETEESSICSVQELPSDKPDWSCRGLGSSQEVACSSFNLDYFGSEDESRSNSSSRASSPPPGVDRELYELIISKMESGNSNIQREDSLNRLMSAAERTIMSARRTPAPEEPSPEAGKMLSELPDLSFMQAKVLMFPIFLAPEAHSSPKLL